MAPLKPASTLPRALDAIQNIADLLLSVLSLDVPPERLPPSVRKVSRQLIEGRKVLMDGGVPEKHIGVRIPSQSLVFGEALVEPQRQLQGDVIGDNGLDRAAIEHVIDDGVHEFVVDHMTEFLVIALKREYNPVLEELRDSSDPFLKVLADDIGLLEIIVGVVHNDRNSIDELVPERLADPGIHGARRPRQ